MTIKNWANCVTALAIESNQVYNGIKSSGLIGPTDFLWNMERSFWPNNMTKYLKYNTWNS